MSTVLAKDLKKTVIRIKKKKKDPRLFFKKLQKGKIQPYEFSKTRLKIIFGLLGIRAKQHGRIFMYQLEALRRFLFKNAGRRLRFWNRSSFSVFLTAKPIAIRMGRGKGALVNVVANISAGSIVAEFSGINKAQLILVQKSLHKFFIHCSIVSRFSYL